MDLPVNSICSEKNIYPIITQALLTLLMTFRKSGVYLTVYSLYCPNTGLQEQVYPGTCIGYCEVYVYTATPLKQVYFYFYSNSKDKNQYLMFPSS